MIKQCSMSAKNPHHGSNQKFRFVRRNAEALWRCCGSLDFVGVPFGPAFLCGTTCAHCRRGLLAGVGVHMFPSSGLRDVEHWQNMQ